MAYKTAGYLKSMVNALRGNSNFATSTSAAHNSFSTSIGGIKSKLPKGDSVPVLVAVGMISLQVSFGLYTAVHLMRRSPNVHLKKSRRETVPEVEDPDLVAEEAEKFVKNSFFRKVAHIQDFDNHDPIRGDVFHRPVHVETLKDVGVDPVRH